MAWNFSSTFVTISTYHWAGKLKVTISGILQTRWQKFIQSRRAKQFARHGDILHVKAPHGWSWKVWQLRTQSLLSFRSTGNQKFSWDPGKYFFLFRIRFESIVVPSVISHTYPVPKSVYAKNIFWEMMLFFKLWNRFSIWKFNWRSLTTTQAKLVSKKT